MAQQDNTGLKAAALILFVLLVVSWGYFYANPNTVEGDCEECQECEICEEIPEYFCEPCPPVHQCPDCICECDDQQPQPAPAETVVVTVPEVTYTKTLLASWDVGDGCVFRTYDYSEYDTFEYKAFNRDGNIVAEGTMGYYETVNVPSMQIKSCELWGISE